LMSATGSTGLQDAAAQRGERIARHQREKEVTQGFNLNYINQTLMRKLNSSP